MFAGESGAPAVGVRAGYGQRLCGASVGPVSGVAGAVGGWEAIAASGGGGGRLRVCERGNDGWVHELRGSVRGLGLEAELPLAVLGGGAVDVHRLSS